MTGRGLFVFCQLFLHLVEQVRVCEAQRSNESPCGAFKRQRGLRQQMEGRCPDKRYPNKITWKTRKCLRSEVPDRQEIFKN